MAGGNVNVSTTLSLDNPVFKAFVTYAVIVLVKTLLMAFATAIQRFSNKSFANAEDTKGMKDKEGGKLKPVVCEEVERVRRCHLNDLENVLPFVLVGLLYCGTGPALSTALLHFRIFAGSRIFHTVAYLLPLPQPSRALGFFGGMAATLSMAYCTVANVGFAL